MPGSILRRLSSETQDHLYQHPVVVEVVRAPDRGFIGDPQLEFVADNYRVHAGRHREQAADVVETPEVDEAQALLKIAAETGRAPGAVEFDQRIEPAEHAAVEMEVGIERVGGDEGGTGGKVVSGCHEH